MRLRSMLIPMVTMHALSAVALACWSAVDKYEYAESCPVIVVGEVISVAGIEADARTFDEIDQASLVSDKASIRVVRVIRNALSDLEVVVGGTIVGNISPVRIGHSVSTDIRYKVGDFGVWLLRLSESGELTLRSHPSQHWPAGDVDLIEEQAAMWQNEDRVTSEQWIGERGAAQR